MPFGKSAAAWLARSTCRLWAVSANAPGVPAGPVTAASITVRVAVLCCPTTAVAGFSDTEVVVLRGFTVCETAAEGMLALKSMLPMNAAVMECGLAEEDSNAVVNEAWPEASCALPSSVVPS